MAGTVVVTTSQLDAGISKYSVDWTSDAAGAVSGNAFAVKHGTIVALTFTPDAGGTAPTTGYDVTLVCAEHSVDMLGGEGANLTLVSTHKVPFIASTGGTSYVRMWMHGGNVDLVVANAGASKGGVVDIYVADGLV